MGIRDNGATERGAPMADLISFDIYLLGLRDPSTAGRTRFANALERLTGRSSEESLELLQRRSAPLFRSLSTDQARTTVNALDDAGVCVEVRPNTEKPPAEGTTLATQECPRCGFVQPTSDPECARCGLVFAKWEREQVQRMQREARLEEALTKAIQVRREWDERAKSFLESHPLTQDATIPFSQELNREEIPFLILRSDEGPLLLTSRRFLTKREEGMFSFPFELVADVDIGGKLVQKKDRVRLQLTFQVPLEIGDKTSKSLSWQLDKDSSFSANVIMDWAFARRFICGSCGAKDLDFRSEGKQINARCMHCATDHEIDLVEALAIPIMQE